jgi:hypothetical protein
LPAIIVSLPFPPSTLLIPEIETLTATLLSSPSPPLTLFTPKAAILLQQLINLKMW